MMREEKLYSTMYIAGTALAIAFTMLIAEVFYVKVADIAPEVRRSTTYYLYGYVMKNDPSRLGNIMHDDFRDLFQKMKTPECVTATTVKFWSDVTFSMKLADNLHKRHVRMKMTEPGFFQFYQFHFVEGVPFTQDDFDNGRRQVVVTEEVARSLTPSPSRGGETVIGATITINHLDYRICGVVERPSELTELCVADVWCPYTAEGLLGEWHTDYHEVAVMVYFSVPADRRDAFMQELKEVEARYNALHKDKPVKMFERLYTHYAWIGRELNDLFGGWDSNLLWYILPSVLLLLFVPAVNLSGMVASRMERRLPEMAVRKAFGAKRRTLLWQVVVENLVLTLIGGIVGLCIAWAALYGWRDWVFVIFAYGATTYTHVPILSGEMLFAPAIFLVSLLVCCVLNVLAATLPAWLSLRKPIVESMMIRK
jgi:putative ABC transport system permease protein